MLVKCFWKTRFFIFNKSIIIKTGLSAVYHTKNVKILVGTRHNLIVIIIAKMMRSSPHVPKSSGGPGLLVHCYFYSLINYCLLTIAYCIQCKIYHDIIGYQTFGSQNVTSDEKKCVKCVGISFHLKKGLTPLPQ